MADRVIFACALVLTAVYFYATAQIPALEIGDPLGPKAFPRLLGIAMLVAAGMLLVEIVRAARKAPAQPAAGQQRPADYGHLRVIAAITVWTAVYVAVFELLGYVIATSIYLIALMAYFHPRHWTANVLTSVLFCAGTYYMFNYMLGVSLARGILPF